MKKNIMRLFIRNQTQAPKIEQTIIVHSIMFVIN